MAKRVATEYVNASLTLTEAEMRSLTSLCGTQQLRQQIFVLENGNQEMVLEDEAGGETIRLTFERRGGRYRCSLSCRVVQPGLTDALRKMVSSFKGDAVVNRIYPGFTMVYHYLGGKVVRIVECKGDAIRTVFEHESALSAMESRYKLCAVEEEIAIVRGAVNELLDLRNALTDADRIAEIDERLRHHSRLLFALEA
ncbi:non-ribosomal peptide synthetase module [Cohnella hashimotonis]|uniref:Non-ribosomal peptide synthetase module n=1 Tax=Cohnella hashimotonis TaxID=2826895 RepID=A0ABT6TDD9_9BACL|nr:non-ribosomal peptide synthetase module [Cohnella hashimotonis]MDI4644837.1 non-ribosomal peptide synthetase module [Cohnella hashimotonis]